MSLHHNQPKGLFLLFFVEMWERFSYYGMRALLMLYMVDYLMFSTEKSAQIYGWYTGMVYLTRSWAAISPTATWASAKP